jgi:ribonuclease HI/DNA modification methylase
MTVEPTADITNTDCITGMAGRPPDSVHLSVFSPPFEELFTYSGKLEDVGNNGSTVDMLAGRFALNVRFFAEQLFRVTARGCNACVHVQQLVAYRNQHGFQGRRHFTAATVQLLTAAGFEWTGEFVIQKDPQAIANRLNLHSLQFKTGRERDANALAPVFNDYVLIFHKPGVNPTPVLPFYHKTKNPTGWIMPDAGGVICPEWVRDAHGVWTDINEMDVLQGAHDPVHREHKGEKHVCALQIEVIRRLVRLYSNPISLQPDVTVMDPFSGIGSTAYVCVGGRSHISKLALEEPRNFVGFELKESYYRSSLNYVADARKQRQAKSAEVVPERTLLDCMGDEPTPSPAPDETEVIEVYADGGVVGRNPSAAGGTWAWCHVTAGGRMAAESSGFVEPADAGTPEVSNNQTEFLALLLCLEALPAGWSGRVFTDSGVTLQRFRDPEGVKQKGVRPEWVDRLRAVRDRLGVLHFTLLGGHPTRADLEAGTRASDGKPVSKWNVYCDKACGAESSRAKARLQPA